MTLSAQPSVDIWHGKGADRLGLVNQKELRPADSVSDLETGGLNVHLRLREVVRADAAKSVDGALLIPKASNLIISCIVISNITHCVATEGVAVGRENIVIIR